MSNINLETSNISKRVLLLSSSYATDKAFLKECEIGNRSFVSELRNGKVYAPSSQMLAQIVRGTGCSGTWLLTGEGAMFEPEPAVPTAGEPADASDYISSVLDRIDRIARRTNGAADTAQSPDEILKVAKLLVTMLERRYENNNC